MTSHDDPTKQSPFVVPEALGDGRPGGNRTKRRRVAMPGGGGAGTPVGRSRRLESAEAVLKLRAIRKNDDWTITNYYFLVTLLAGT
jgi:hypothetical protein